MTASALPPGQRNPSWPWWLRSGMRVWLDGADFPLGTVIGCTGSGHPVIGSPHLPVTAPLHYWVDARSLIPCPPEREVAFFRVLAEWRQDGIFQTS